MAYIIEKMGCGLIKTKNARDSVATVQSPPDIFRRKMHAKFCKILNENRNRKDNLKTIVEVRSNLEVSERVEDQ